VAKDTKERIGSQFKITDYWQRAIQEKREEEKY